MDDYSLRWRVYYRASCCGQLLRDADLGYRPSPSPNEVKGCCPYCGEPLSFEKCTGRFYSRSCWFKPWTWLRGYGFEWKSAAAVRATEDSVNAAWIAALLETDPGLYAEVQQLLKKRTGALDVSGAPR